ncbi:MAG: ChaN family lipoprotein, partial [Planctomycetota bacterium]
MLDRLTVSFKRDELRRRSGQSLRASALGFGLLLAFGPGRAAAENPTPTEDDAGYRIYLGNGEPTTLEALVRRARTVEVVFLGEYHDDPVAHQLEETILRRLAEPASPGEPAPPLTLSLEMFERDVQPVVDEYLAGLITEDHFKASGRAWDRYDPDYRPLIEFAKERGLAVVAANAPRRYVNLVGRRGRTALTEVPDPALRGLPPLPYATASPAYEAKFRAIMASFRRQDDKPSAEKAEEDDGAAGENPTAETASSEDDAPSQEPAAEQP